MIKGRKNPKKKEMLKKMVSSKIKKTGASPFKLDNGLGGSSIPNPINGGGIFTK